MQELIERLRKVGTGIGLIYAALILAVIAGLAIGIGGGVVAGQRAAQQQQLQIGNPRIQRNPFAPGGAGNPMPVDLAVEAKGGVRYILVVGGLLMIFAGILDLIGRFLCLAVPPECQGAPYIQASLVLVVINVLIQVWSVLGEAGAAPVVPPIVSAISGLVGLVSGILFMIFLRLLAEYIHRDDLAQTARSVLNLAVFLVIAAIGVGVVAFGLALLIPPIALLALLGFLGIIVMGLVLLIRYARLLSNLRMALLSYAAALEENPPEDAPLE